MKQRRIYTRGGDQGLTFCPALGRVPKTTPRVMACGGVDETNCAIGELAVRVKAAASIDPARRRRAVKRLKAVQRELFTMGTLIAGSAPARRGASAREAARVERLESEIDEMENEMPPCEGFILPGGNPLAAAAHLARSTCRRAERDAVAALHDYPAGMVVIPYLNRLADWLFVMARWLTHAAGFKCEYWHKPSPQKVQQLIRRQAAAAGQGNGDGDSKRSAS
jgi:cob(I)alamin adenosyltransferase